MAGLTDGIYEALAQNRPPGEEAAIIERHRATEQFRRAWEIISPGPERQAECEHRLVYAILLIQREAHIAKERIARGDKTITAAEWKKDLKKRIKKLRAAESAVDDEYLADLLGEKRESMEEELAYLNTHAVVQKGKPRRSEIKDTAVHQARELILRFSSKQPSLYRDGAWHNLAKVLFGGDARTDLFEYLERYSGPGQAFDYTPRDGLQPITKEPPLWWLARGVGQR
jgi:hypothetical protein